LYGSLAFANNMILDFDGIFNFIATNAGQTITSNNKIFTGQIYFNGIGGVWALQDDFTTNSLVFHDAGTLNANGNKFQANQYRSQGTLARTLNMGNSEFRMTGNGTVWSISGSNVTINSGTSVINLTGSVIPYFFGGGFTYYDLNFTTTDPTTDGAIFDVGTFRNVNFTCNATFYANITANNVTLQKNGYLGSNINSQNLTLTAGYSYVLGTSATIAVANNLNATGNCGAFINLKSITDGTQATISKPTGIVNASYLILKDIRAIGGATFNTNNSIDQGNNTGWNINTTPVSNLYWIGNSGNWSDGAHWSLTSGGAPSGCAPSPRTNVFFDANSFTAPSTVTLNSITSYCRNISWAGATNTPTFAGDAANEIYISGSLQFIAGMNVTYDGNTFFDAVTAGNTITSATKAFNGNVLFKGINSTYTFQDNFTNTGYLFLDAGTLNTNGVTVSTFGFRSQSSNNRALNLGASTVNISQSSSSWTVSAAGIFTLNAGTSTINFLSGGTIFANFGTGHTYHDVNFSNTSASALANIQGSNTFRDVLVRCDANINTNNTFRNLSLEKKGTFLGNNSITNLTLTAGYSYLLRPTTTQTILGTINAVGNCGAFINIQSNLSGSTATITKTAGVINNSFLILKDVVANGGATFNANSSVNLGNNTGWNFTSPTGNNFYWIGNSGNWSDGTHWSLTSGGTPSGCSPSPLDNVFFDANSFSIASQTVTINVPIAYCRNMSWSGATGNPSLAGVATNELKIFGSLAFIPTLNYTFLGPINFEATTTGHTITTASKSFLSNVSFAGTGGGWILQDSLTTTRTIFLNAGSFNTNNQKVKAQAFQSRTVVTRALNMGSSIFILNGAGTFWDVTGANLALNAGTSTIISTSNFIPSFYGGSLTYYDVQFTGIDAGLDATLSDGNTFHNVLANLTINIRQQNTFNELRLLNDGLISDNNTYNTLILSADYTYRLASARTQTILNRLQAQGTCTQYLILESTIPGSPAIIRKTIGNVLGFNIHMKDITGNGGATFFAYNSLNLGNNSGWNFTILPTLLPPNVVVGPATICAGATSVTYTSSPVSGAIFYQWSVPPGATITSGQGDTTITVNFGTATSGSVSVLTFNGCNYNTTGSTLTVVVGPSTPPTVSIAANPNGSICAGDAVTITATAANIGANTVTYNFRVNGISVQNGASPTYNYTTPVNGATITCDIVTTGSNTCSNVNTASSNTITIQINNSPSTPTVSIAANPTGAVCAGLPITFTATPLNFGGGTVTYNFMVDAVTVQNTTSNTYASSTLSNGQIVSCTITITNGSCLTSTTAVSNSLTASITAIPIPTINIVASNSTFCAGTNVSFTATITNGGASPAYQWQVNGANVGTNSANFSSTTLVNADVITCSLISNLACVSTVATVSNALTMQVTTVVTPTINISSNVNNVCPGTNITFTANATNTGLNPTYQWKVNGVNAGTNSATFSANNFNNNDIVTCTLTSSLNCVSANNILSNNISLNILPQENASISITSSTNNICPNTNVTFAATTLNPGTTPIFQWNVNGINVGTNSNIFSSNSLLNGDIVTCSMVSNFPCVSATPFISNSIVMVVLPILNPTILITASNNNICAGSAVVFNSNVTNAGTNPTYQWQVNGNNVGTNSSQFSSTTLQNNDVVTCSLSSSVPCPSSPVVASNAINMVVITEPTPAISIVTASSNICAGKSILFSATATNANVNPSYQWQINGVNVGTNSSNYSSNTIKNNDVVTCIIKPTTGCFAANSYTSNNIAITVFNNPTVDFNPANISILHGNEITLSPTITTNNLIYNWSPSIYLSNTNTVNPISKPDENITYFLKITDTNNCEALDSIKIRVLKGIFIPTVFTPNSDGQNDVFRIPPFTAIEKLQYFIVYNRYGQKVFETNNLATGWNGKINGEQAPMGNYVYIIKASDIKGEIILKGSILLMR
jgi:gliding motility-associated-like protein